MMASTSRKPLELRPIAIEQGVLQHHDGSASFAFGPVNVWAAVTGPTEVRIREERTDRAALQIYLTPLQGVVGTSITSLERHLISIFSAALQLHLSPRASIQLHLQVYAAPAMLVRRPLLQPQQPVPMTMPPAQPPHPDALPSVVVQAATINAATLACLDAAVAMRCLVVAASAVVIRRGIRANLHKGWRAGESTVTEETMTDDLAQWEILLDPSPYEESLARSTHVFAFAFTAASSSNDTEAEAEPAPPLTAQLVFNDSRGKQSTQQYLDCLRLCRQASQDIAQQMRKAMAARLLGSA